MSSFDVLYVVEVLHQSSSSDMSRIHEHHDDLEIEKLLQRKKIAIISIYRKLHREPRV